MTAQVPLRHDGFWAQVRRPFFVLAPMVNVTDTVFRQMIVKYSRPDAVWTEFVSCDGLCSKGQDRLLRDLQFTPGERPIVAQLFGANPTTVYSATKLIAELGFDGVDINMGCPDRAVVGKGAGAGLIRTPTLAQEIIRAAQEGATATTTPIPVSVKTRLGFTYDEVDSWFATLLNSNLSAVTIHGRTAAELSKAPVRWQQIQRVAEMAQGTGTRIIGNGDVASLSEGRQRVTETGIDGVMLGRAVFGNPWLFRENTAPPEPQEVLRVLIEHTNLFEETWGKTKPFELMRKHFKAYVSGFSGAHELRLRLMDCVDGEAVEQEITQFLREHPSVHRL